MLGMDRVLGGRLIAVPLVFVIVAVVVLVLAVRRWQAAQQRREALHEWAFKHGLSYAAEDNGLPDRYPFTLFQKGDGRGADNVISGTWDGVPVVTADYWYYDESTDSEGHTSRSYSRFSVVVVELAAWVPAVRIEHEGFLSRLADHVGLRDIDFESEEFNRRYNVQCDDREFAFKLLDARMMQWLQGPAADFCIEVNGDHALLWRDRTDEEGVAVSLAAAKAFVEHVPRLVWNEYGKAAS